MQRRMSSFFADGRKAEAAKLKRSLTASANALIRLYNSASDTAGVSGLRRVIRTSQDNIYRTVDRYALYVVTSLWQWYKT